MSRRVFIFKKKRVVLISDNRNDELIAISQRQQHKCIKIYKNYEQCTLLNV